MPPQVHTRTDGFQAWFDALPPVTKLYMCLIFGVTVADLLGLIPMMKLILHWPSIIHGFEIWRLVTHFFVLGPFSLSWLFNMLFLHNYGVPLESGTFMNRTADYVWIFTFCGGLVMLLSILGYLNILPMLISGANADFMIMVIMFVWSRNFKDMSVSIWGLFKMQAFYLPFAMLALRTIMGASPVPGILAICLGHLYHFLHSIYPRAGGRNLIPTPQWLKNAIARSGVGVVNPAEVTARMGAEGRAFTGRGRRLAD
eukprot:CAMPEP_0117693120 /NCGR_PEP_ID=MMETSP0804-20121206/26702_1 /TAXON_ID=1074897 /ORGANISM="Tetraselmis astigmatica, Strain CCMP880" /LENGTH=255 /DNA_ID=CAMNT_0005506635 /DNA_START=276 /DNA_END=1043 /DNA_ORIENTATION=+